MVVYLTQQLVFGGFVAVQLVVSAPFQEHKVQVKDEKICIRIVVLSSDSYQRDRQKGEELKIGMLLVKFRM